MKSQRTPSVPSRVCTSEQLEGGRGADALVLHGVFDDVRVDASHAVDRVRSHDAQMSHVDFLCVSFLDQGHSAQAVVISGVELVDALEEQKTQIFFLPPPNFPSRVHTHPLKNPDSMK